MKKIDFDYLSNYTYGYKYLGDGSGDWNYYLQFKRNRVYSIQNIEFELSQLPLINECEIHLEGMTWDGFTLSVVWKGNVHWWGSFQLEYHSLDLYDTDFLEYLEDKIDTESKKFTKKFRESKKSMKESKFSLYDLNKQTSFVKDWIRNINKELADVSVESIGDKEVVFRVWFDEGMSLEVFDDIATDYMPRTLIEFIKDMNIDFNFNFVDKEDKFTENDFVFIRFVVW